MTDRGGFLAALICGVIFLGLLTRSSGVLILSLPLLFYLGAAILSAPEDVRVTVERTLDADRASYGAPVDVTLVVENAGPAVDELHVEDVLPPGLALVSAPARGSRSNDFSRPPRPGTTEVVTSSGGAGATVSLAYTVRGGRGRFRFEGVNVTASDHFGLFRRELRLAPPGQVLVYPEVAPLRHIDLRPQRTYGFAGPIAARRAGSGVDFFGVRQYVLGDRLRKINWRVSARHDRRLFTNEFEQESLADVGLILDARTQTDVRTPAGSLFEHSVHATASLASLFLKEGHRVGLLIYGPMAQVFPGYGAAQRGRILNALAGAQTRMSYAFENLSSLPIQFFPPRSQLVVVSPLLPDDVAPLLRFLSLGYAMLVVSPDPIDFEVRAWPSAAGLDGPLRLARIERAVTLGSLRRAGVRVVSWQTNRLLDQALLLALARQPLAPPLAAVLR